LGGFRLDKYDVTVGRFRQFMKAIAPADGGAAWLPSVGSGKHSHLNGGQGLAVVVAPGQQTIYEDGWSSSGAQYLRTTHATGCTWTDSPGNNERLPMACVNWAEAYAFCIWDGGFLPSGAELMYAMEGGQGRTYPWGGTDPGSASQYAIYNQYLCDHDASPVPLACISPVGFASLGAGRWGQLDLIGNVDQWVLDGTSNALVFPYYGCDDCLRDDAAFYHPYLGANWESTVATMGAGSFAESTDSLQVGLRCARSP
jgi:formylglycine-generating enzyme required for sulfatase activity